MNNGIEAKSLDPPPGLQGLREEAFQTQPNSHSHGWGKGGEGERSLHTSAEVTLSLSEGLLCVCPCRERLPGSSGSWTQGEGPELGGGGADAKQNRMLMSEGLAGTQLKSCSLFLKIKRLSLLFWILP